MVALRHSKPPGSVLELHELLKVSKFQPELHYILDVALTLPVTSSSAERAVTSSSAERAFSRLQIVKSHLRTTMSADRLQRLLRITANKKDTISIPLGKMIDQF